MYLQSKNEIVDAFQNWFSKIENKLSQSMKTICANREKEFISIKLRDFCNKKGIILKYATLYMHKENGIAKRGWQTIITMKDLLLLDRGLPLDFLAEVIDTTNYLRNRLLTKTQQEKLITKKARTEKKQDVNYFKIFG